MLLLCHQFAEKQVKTPTVRHVTCSTERPQEGSGGDGSSLEVYGEEGEDSLDQEGSGGPETL